MKAEYLRYGLENLLHRRLRSGLTVLSILIGIIRILIAAFAGWASAFLLIIPGVVVLGKP